MRSTIVEPDGDVWSKKRSLTMLSVWRSAARRSSGFSRSLGSPWWERSRLCRHSTAARTSSRLARVGLRLVFAQPFWEVLASGRACAPAGTSSATSASTIASPGPLRRVVERNKEYASRVLQSDSDRRVDDPKPLSIPSATRLTRPCEPRGFASRPRGRFALSGGEPTESYRLWSAGLEPSEARLDALARRARAADSVGVPGFEPVAPPPQTACSTRLSYTPKI